MMDRALKQAVPYWTRWIFVLNRNVTWRPFNIAAASKDATSKHGVNS